MSATTGQRLDPQAGSSMPAVGSGWGTWRGFLLVWLCAVAAVIVLAGVRPASLADLQSELASGRLTDVTVVGGLQAGGGQARADILWDDGPFTRVTTVHQVGDDASDQGFATTGTTVVGPDLLAELRAWTPGGELTVTSEGWRSGGTFEAYSWQAPGWVGLPVLAWTLVVLVTLVRGPEPRIATRWAWFWLLVGAGPLALAAYVVVGLPRVGAPAQSTGRRLTGGWALLLGLIVL